MDQFDEIINIIKTISHYLVSDKIGCEQVPVDDIIYTLEQEYLRVDIKSDTISDTYKRLMLTCIERNDKLFLSGVLDSLVSMCNLLTELYSIQSSDLNLKIYPYRVEAYYYRNKEKNLQWRKRNKHETSVFSGRGAVYTAVTGGYDAIHEPEIIDDRLDYFLFTDADNVHSDVYKVIKIDNTEGLDAVRLSKMIKIIGNWKYLADYDYTIWADGKLQIQGDLMEYINTYTEGAPLLCFNHYVRDDLYEEAEACASINIDDPVLIRGQIERYHEEGFPEHYGLIDACLLIKDNKSEALKKAMEDWWMEVKNGSKRDQLSFSYAFWKNNVIYDTSPLLSIDNPIVKTHKHTF